MIDSSLHRMSLLDRAAIGLSGVCLVHCLALPVAALFLPMLAGAGKGTEWLHVLLVAVAAPVSTLALRHGWLHHRQVMPAYPAAAGFTLMLGALAVHGSLEAVLTVVGGLLVAAGHLLNWRLLQRRALSVHA